MHTHVFAYIRMFNMRQIPSSQFEAVENLRRILSKKIVFNVDIYVLDTSNSITYLLNYLITYLLNYLITFLLT